MFRTIELSEPQFENGNLRFITVKTPNLKGRGDICLFVPPLKNLKKVPLVILLHGVYGSAWVWSQKAGVHLTAWEMMEKNQILPMVIAMPSDGLWGDGSGYLPHHGLNFEKWIVEDVPRAVTENIGMVNELSDIFISGLSMGGFGALRLGAKYPHKFKAVSAHSSITELQQMKLFVEEPIEGYLEGKEDGHSVWETMRESHNVLPPLRFDCGTDDDLIDQNRLLHQKLLASNIDHVYEEFTGGHEWTYWSKHIRDTLLFFSNKCANNT